MLLKGRPFEEEKKGGQPKEKTSFRGIVVYQRLDLSNNATY